MKEILRKRSLNEIIKECYGICGYKSSEEFLNLLKENNIEALGNLIELTIEANAPKPTIKELLLKGIELNDIKSTFTLAHFYETGEVLNEYKPFKAEELYLSLIKKESCPMIKLDLANLYLFNRCFINKRDIGLSIMMETYETGGAVSYKAAKIFIKLNELDYAIKSYKKARIHIIKNDKDLYDDIDEEGVMKYFYALIADCYIKLGNTDDGMKYLQKGLDANMDNAFILAGYLCFLDGKYDEAKELYDEVFETSKMEASFALGELYSTPKYHGYDLKKAYYCFDLSNKLGHPNADDELKKIEPMVKCKNCVFNA